MLPFMKPKQIASIILQKRAANGNVVSESEEGQEHPQLMEHARDLIAGVHAKDEQKVAQALEAAHKFMNPASEPEEA